MNGKKFKYSYFGELEIYVRKCFRKNSKGSSNWGWKHLARGSVRGIAGSQGNLVVLKVRGLIGRGPRLLKTASNPLQ